MHGDVTALDQPHHLAPEKAVDKYVGRAGIRWVGDGAQLYSNLIEERATNAGYRFIVADTQQIHGDADAWIIMVRALTLAEHVASLALTRLQDASPATANGLRAIYVRPSDAEMKL